MPFKKPTILQVVHSLGMGGAEKLVYELSKNLRDDFDFIICCLDYIGELGDNFRKAGFKVYCLYRRMGVDLRLVSKMKDLCRWGGVDIIHAHQYTPYFYSMLTKFVYPKLRLIFTEHGRHQPDRIRWKRVIFNKVAEHFTDAITGVSRFSKDSLVRYERFSSNRIDVIYNGIRIEEYDKIEVDRLMFKESLGIPPSSKIIGCVARFAPIKNHEYLIDVFGCVSGKIDDVVLCLVGNGPLMPEIKNKVKFYGLDKKVLFLGLREDVGYLLKAFDIFTLSSIAEASSLTLLEAMASGCCVVVTDVGGNKEIVENGKNGYLVPLKNKQRYAEVLINCLENEALRRELAGRAKATIKEKFSIDRMLHEYKDLYLSVLQRRPNVDPS